MVALVWQHEFARAGMAQVQWYHRMLLALVVWLIYAADRWIEGLRLDARQVRTRRHWFYIRHRRGVAVIGALALLVGGGVAVMCLSAVEWWCGTGVAVLVGVYLFSHQYLHRKSDWRAPKETCVAVLFATGCALAPALQPEVHAAALAGLATLFALLCFTNCALISAWEEAIDRSHGQTSLTLQFSFGRRLSRHLAWLGMGVGAAMAIAPAVGSARGGAICMAVSSGLLGVLDLVQPRVGNRAARVLADAVLLTPLVLFLLPGRFIA